MNQTERPEMLNFYEDDPPTKFVAIYSDGSGCHLFYKDEKGRYQSPDHAFQMADKEWFIDAGFLWFLPLPDDFEVWEAQKENISSKIHDKG